MKVFFGDVLDDMVKELRGQAVNNVRLHALYEAEGDVLRVNVHVTTLCNNQVYESVISTKMALGGATGQKRDELIVSACDQEREKVARRLEGFEVRRGVLQE
jgi:hypothetical protein